MNDADIAALMQGRGTWSAELTDAANAHGALPLIASQLRRSGSALSPEMEQAARVFAAHDAVRRRELDMLFARFEAARVPALVVKGEALARTHYAHSALRPRCDTDLLVRDDAVERATELLRACGYSEEPASGGELISRQRMWIKRDTLGIRHCIDLHWALSNRQRYARAFTFDELFSRGVALTEGAVRMPSPADALLLAAVHLAAHHSDEHRLIWLYDIHLLHASLNVAELQKVALRARERQVDLAFDAALALALRWFRDGHAADGGATMPVRGELGDFVDDLRCTPGLRPKLRLMREHLFPPAQYVLQKYGARSRRALPALYLRRVVGRLLRAAKT